MNSVKHLYLNIGKVNEYFQKINKNKYLMVVLANESKDIIKHMKKCGVKSTI